MVAGKGATTAKWANKLKRKLGLKSKSYYDPERQSRSGEPTEC